MSNEIRQLKEKEVADIVEKIKKAQSVVIIDYRGISVLEVTQLRSALRKENIEYKVIKNRLMLRALKTCGFEGFDKMLEGTTAVAFGYNDSVTPAKLLVETAKKINKTAIKGGIADGKKLGAAEMAALAKVPAKPVLVAQLLGLLTNPMRSLAVALSEIAKKNA